MSPYRTPSPPPKKPWRMPWAALSAAVVVVLAGAGAWWLAIALDASLDDRMCIGISVFGCVAEPLYRRHIIIVRPK